MNNDAAPSGPAVEVVTWIAARPETVFGRFTDPADFAHWMGGKLGVATIEPWVGGAIRVDFGGRTMSGTILTLDAPHTFAFTWGNDDGAPLAPGSTTVTLSLTAADGGTRLVLRHDGLPNEEIARGNRVGWALYAGMLAYLAAQREHGARVPALVRAWFDAWAADDVDRRLACLAACLTDDGELRDDVAALTGHAAIERHLANSRLFMKGIDLVPLGEPDLVHGVVRFGWQALRGDAVLVRGANFAELGPDGRFRRVHGFRDRA